MEATARYLHQEINECGSAVELLAILNALIDSLKENNDFRSYVSNSKDFITTPLFDIINHPRRHLQKALKSKHMLEQTDSSDKIEPEILRLIRRAALKCISLIRDFDYTESRIQTLLNILNPAVKYDSDAPLDLFCFSKQFSSSLKDGIKEIIGSEVQANCVKVTRAHLLSVISELKIYEPLLIKLSPIVLTQLAMWLCELEVDQEEGAVLGLADILVSDGLAWRKDRLKIGLSSTFSEGKEKWLRGSDVTSKTISPDRHVTEDIIITEIMDGNFFWMLLGRDVIENVSGIHTCLKENQAHLKCTTLVVSKEIVAVRLNTPDGTKITRCQILHVDHQFATVFGVDIGGLHRVNEKDVFALPSELNLSSLPPQVALGRLKDLLPTPTDPLLVEMTLNFLTKLIMRSKFMIVQPLVELKILPSLHTLIDCPNVNVTKQALALATNLLLMYRHDSTKEWRNILLVTLDLVNQIIFHFSKNRASIGGKSSTKWQNGIANKMSKTPPQSSKSLIHHLKSSHSVQEERFSNSNSLTHASLLLFANFVHMNKYAKDYFYHQNGLETALRAYLCMKHNWHLRGAAIRLFANFVHIITRKQLLDNEPGGIGRSLLSEEKIAKLEVTGQSFEDDDGDTRAMMMPVEEDQLMDFNEAMHEEEKSVNSPVKDREKIKFYERDSSYPFSKDPSYELLPSINLKAGFMASVMCGMLNTGHEGTISLGISEDSVVKGVKLSHGEREGVRNGIKDIMDIHIMPHLLYPQLDIRFVPVAFPRASQEEVDDGNVYNNLYVVEIICKPLLGIVYSCRDNQAYYRFGFKTGPLNEQDVRHLVVIEEEALHREKIQELQSIVRNLEQKLSLDSE